jgi:xylan 1,4-beta-xylosidase
MKDGRYKLNVYRIGYGQNDAYTAYLRMGAPQQLTRDQVAKLKEAASGAPVESRTVSVKGGIYEERFEMRENDVVLVVLQH